MNHKETKTLQDLVASMTAHMEENQRFRREVTEKMHEVECAAKTRLEPVEMQSVILATAQRAMEEAIKTVLTGYSSPLIPLITSVITQYSAELRETVRVAFEETIRKDEFKSAILAGFSHKIARSIISNNDGLFEKVSNELKQDTIFRSKMHLAVSQVVEDCLKDRKNG